ncbi:hypothetical protein [Pseudonocardia parietis]|uniref:Uncharacterized protein n=1 Tax=Pseudonocardia parietis TaxID=570936 RepID=A0ABS4VTS9_9PSEU|nr:hypothetical protein [Pseudonocardia parietis]MBP2367333.1 hypothetical protein [Pseudonocardia parietis]
MSAPHADDHDTAHPEDRRNGHPSATVLDGPVVPSPRASPAPDAVPDPAEPDGTPLPDDPAGLDVPGPGAADTGAGGTAVLGAGGAAGTGGSQGIPAQQSRQGTVPPTLHPGRPGSGAPLTVPAPAGLPGAIPPAGPGPWTPGAAGPDGRAAGFPTGQPTPPMPWPAVRPTIGAPVPTVQPDEPQAAPAWRRALDSLEPARLSGLSASLRGTVGHRTAAVTVGATLALAVGVLVAAYSGTGQESGDPQSAPAPAPVAVPPDLVSGTTAADPAAFGVAPAFTSPSGNIACRIHGGEARCDVENKRWTPTGAEDCTDAGLVVGGPAGARASCTGTPVEGDAAELDYRTHLTRGDVTCVSRRSGVECRDARSGHGFTVARSSYRLY